MIANMKKEISLKNFRNLYHLGLLISGVGEIDMISLNRYLSRRLINVDFCVLSRFIVWATYLTKQKHSL